MRIQTGPKVLVPVLVRLSREAAQRNDPSSTAISYTGQVYTSREFGRSDVRKQQTHAALSCCCQCQMAVAIARRKRRKQTGRRIGLGPTMHGHEEV